MAIKRKIVSAPVGSNLSSNPADVQALRFVLSALGYNDPNQDFGYMDQRLKKNILSFQKDNGLRADGIVQPGGKTEKMMISNLINDDDDEEASRSPVYWCTECGGPHGGSAGDMCPDCTTKSEQEGEG